jgi:predicted nucleotidyltransferase
MADIFLGEKTMNEDLLLPLLERFQNHGCLKVALLFGSYARGDEHSRSDIDLALFLKPADPEEEMALIDEILMSSDKQIGILRLDDDEESPFIVQKALKGTHLIEPDPDILYDLYHRVLHETETIRFRRESAVG